MPKNESGKPVPIEFPHLCVFDSSAGSGKTHQLTLHYLRLLLNTDPRTRHDVRNVLAITFTNAAVNEMRHRIIGWMKAIVLDSDEGPTRFLLEPMRFGPRTVTMVDASPEVIKSRVSSLLEDSILRHFDDFRITTIDSFVATLLKAQSLKLGIPPDFEIAVDVDPYLSGVMDSLLQDILTDGRVRNAFLEFLDSYESLVPPDSLQWSPRGFIEEKIRTIWDWFLSNSADIDRFVREAPASASSVRERRDHFEALNREFRGFGADLSEACAKGVRIHAHFLKFVSRGLVEPGDLAGLFGRKGLEDSLLKNSADIPLKLRQKWRRLLSEADAYLTGYSVSFYSSLRELFGLFMSRLNENVSSRQRTVLMPQLSHLVSQIVRGVTERGDYINELFLYLHGRYYHYLIDEFQDTNRVQWENMEFLVEENLSRGGSLLVVGDNKQLIYGWRGASLGLMRTFRRPFGHLPFYEETLSDNRRSAERIVEFNNAVFDAHNLAAACAPDPGEDADFAGLLRLFYAASRQQSLPVKKDTGLVEAVLIQTEGDRESAFRAVGTEFDRIVGSILGRRPASDLCVLCRTNEEARTVVEWLLEKGLSVEAEITVDIRNNGLIREFLSLVNFFNNPSLDFHLMNFLTGEIFGAFADKPGPAAGEGKTAEWCRTALLNGRRPLYAAFREDHPSVWEELFERFFRLAGYLSMYEFALLLMKRWDVFGLFPAFGPYFLKFLEAVHRIEKEDGSDLANLPAAFSSGRREELFLLDTSESADAVRVTTIHKSKGLAFPVVILPFAGYRRDRPASMYFDRSDDGTAEIYHIDSRLRNVGRLRGIYNEANARTRLEEINNLYVAFTRPAEELHLILPSSKGTENMFSDAIFKNPAFSANFAADAARLRLGSEPPSRPVAKISRPEHPFKNLPAGLKWSELLGRTPVSPTELLGRRFAVKNESPEERGIIAHEILQRLGTYSAEGLGEAIRLALARRGITAGGDFATGLRSMLESAFKDPVFRAFFTIGAGDSAKTELEIVDRKASRHRIDRLVVRTDRIELLDFKTGSVDEETHPDQVRRYAELVAELYPDKPVRGWLYYLDLGNLREIDCSFLTGSPR